MICLSLFITHIQNTAINDLRSHEGHYNAEGHIIASQCQFIKTSSSSASMETRITDYQAESLHSHSHSQSAYFVNGVAHSIVIEAARCGCDGGEV